MNKRVFWVTSVFVTFWAMQKVTRVSSVEQKDHLINKKNQ
jgi:hypothetical protein